VSQNGRIYTAGYLGCFIDSLAAHCTDVVTFQHTPLPHELEFIDYQVKADNVRLVNIGPHYRIPTRTLHYLQNRKDIARYAGDLDLLLLRGPSPLLPAIAQTFATTPKAFLIVGDYTRNIEDLPRPLWRRELIRIWSLWNKRRQMAFLKNGLTIVNNQIFYDEMRPRLTDLVQTRTTTLSNNDFYEREDTCQNKPVRLLYTGRMDRQKGLFDMVDAVAILTQAEVDVTLDLVGWPSKRDTIVDEVAARAQAKNVTDRVNYLGFKALGPELFACYKAADIYLIGSRQFEGFPRTIWEAMAHSLPVIATRIKSIADLIDGHALLIEPGQPAQFAAAVQKLMDDPALRQKLIADGRALARGMTLETQTAALIANIERWLSSLDRAHLS